MKTLRNILLLLVLAMAAATASAETGRTKRNKATTRQVAAPQNHQRHEVAPFVDPTLPLAGMVEQVRAERAKSTTAQAL